MEVDVYACFQMQHSDLNHTGSGIFPMFDSISTSKAILTIRETDIGYYLSPIGKSIFYP
uniref:Uncharacterized protein n=1 Tax=Rhizophora mucronata TaxID=61149 RepID=A0A2P2NV15_RHIMU